MGGTEPTTATTTKERFRFGGRILTASGTQVDGVHTNVFRLSIDNGSLDNIILKFFFCLPLVIQKWAKPYVPEWFLPPTIICKKQKAEYAELFANEKNMYMRLQRLQGTVIPIFYGEVTCADGAPGLLLSDIGGNVLCSPNAAGISEGLLKALFGKVFDALAIYNIAHDYAKLDNFLLVGRNRIMVVDLEMAEEREPGDLEIFNNSSTRHLCLAYRRHQEVLKVDGFLKKDGSPNALLPGFRAVAPYYHGLQCPVQFTGVLDLDSHEIVRIVEAHDTKSSPVSCMNKTYEGMVGRLEAELIKLGQEC